MNIVIKIYRDPKTFVESGSGLYVKHYDPSGGNGNGDIQTTTNRAEAKEFADKGHAFEYWRAQSTTHPWRPDGKPNRPLTAFTVEIADEPPTKS